MLHASSMLDKQRSICLCLHAIADGLSLLNTSITNASLWDDQHLSHYCSLEDIEVAGSLRMFIRQNT